MMKWKKVSEISSIFCFPSTVNTTTSKCCNWEWSKRRAASANRNDRERIITEGMYRSGLCVDSGVHSWWEHCTDPTKQYGIVLVQHCFSVNTATHTCLYWRNFFLKMGTLLRRPRRLKRKYGIVPVALPLLFTPPLTLAFFSVTLALSTPPHTDTDLPLLLTPPLKITRT